MIDTKDELTFEVEFLCCVVDKKNDFVIVDADKHFCEFVGIHYSKIKQGKLSLLDLMIPQNRQEIVEKINKKDSPFVYFNLYILDNTGSYNHVHCAVRNNDKDSLCEFTIADVGRSEEKSRELKEKAETLDSLVDLVSGGVCLFKVNQDMHFEVQYANDACCKFFGTSRDRFINREYRIDDLIHAEDKSAAFQAIGKTMATKKPIEMELRILTHKDQFLWVKMNSNIHRYDKDNCPIFHAVFTDITDIKQAEQEAEIQKERLVKTFKNMPGPIFCVDYFDPMKLVVVSEDFTKLLGYTRKELFEEYDGDLAKLISPRDLEIAKGVFAQEHEIGKTIKTMYSVRTKSGKYIVVKDRRRAVELDNGEKSMIGILRDVTEKNVEQFIDLQPKNDTKLLQTASFLKGKGVVFILSVIYTCMNCTRSITKFCVIRPDCSC